MSFFLLVLSLVDYLSSFIYEMQDVFILSCCMEPRSTIVIFVAFVIRTSHVHLSLKLAYGYVGEYIYVCMGSSVFYISFTVLYWYTIPIWYTIV